MDLIDELIRRTNQLDQRLSRLETQQPGAGLTDLWVWNIFTPTWTASTTNPSLGNGTISGRYLVMEKMCVALVRIVMGSTTTYGTGNWRITLPIAPASQNYDFPGQARGIDTSASLNYVAGLSPNLTGYVEFASHGGGLWGPTVPFTWANGDNLRMALVYWTV